MGHISSLLILDILRIFICLIQQYIYNTKFFMFIFVIHIIIVDNELVQYIINYIEPTTDYWFNFVSTLLIETVSISAKITQNHNYNMCNCTYQTVVAGNGLDVGMYLTFTEYHVSVPDDDTALDIK